MIYTLTITCVFGLTLKDDCIRVLEISEDSSLYDLHQAIQAAVKFDDDHLFGFYLAKGLRGRRQWLGRDGGDDQEERYFSETPLRSIFPTSPQQLFYLFDFGDSWTFEIRKARGAKAPVPRAKYPRVIAREGRNPTQYSTY